MSLHTQIIEYLENHPGMNHKRQIYQGLGNIRENPGNLERRMRELAETGKIKKTFCDCVGPRHIVYWAEKKQDWWHEKKYMTPKRLEPSKLF